MVRSTDAPIIETERIPGGIGRQAARGRDEDIVGSDRWLIDDYII
jgi:hypothetical protein